MPDDDIQQNDRCDDASFDIIINTEGQSHGDE